MLLILASCYDHAARALAGRWFAQDAQLLTCADLSAAGWRHYLGAPAASTVAVGGRTLPLGAVSGVLTRLPCVTEQELPQIVPADRAYVAAEMTAFLRSWLFELACPVLNRPTPTCLGGPNWWPQQWIAAAARLGIPVRPVRRQVALGDVSPAETRDPAPIGATVVDDRCFGAVADELAQQARRLATVAGVDLLGVSFDGADPGSALIGANPWPDVSSPEIADAVAAYLMRGHA